MKPQTSDLIIESYPPPTPKGGQHVGTIETGVKIVHKPTGITVICSHYRSQMKNKDVALEMIEYALTFNNL